MLVLPAVSPGSIVIFAPGAGGDPLRYRQLLDALVANGSTVLAPASARLSPHAVTAEHLRERVRALKASFLDHGLTDLPVIAMGHSIGGCAALCLAGARPRAVDGAPIQVAAEERITRLVLLAPSLGWFRAPGALADVQAPISVFVGARDAVTPPATTDILQSAPVSVDVRVHENAGHFDYMSDLPPGTTPTPGLDQSAFLEAVARRISTSLR